MSILDKMLGGGGGGGGGGAEVAVLHNPPTEQEPNYCKARACILLIISLFGCTLPSSDSIYTSLVLF